MERIHFGRTGHRSTRVLFGAAALGAMRQEKADQVLETLIEFGVNHIDTAASYGDSELRVGPWMARHRDRFFLASKTGDRTAEGARASIARSLERLQVEQLDIIQLHNLVDEEGWRTAMGPGGALEALLEARERGQVRFLGVTGHGTFAPAMHHRSLERFPFDSVLVPYNFSMLQDPTYRAELEALLAVCEARGVAVQTIKSVARRRWREDDESRRFSWYEPLRDPDAIARAVHFVLARPGLFLNSSSDATLLRPILTAATHPAPAPAAEVLRADADRYAVEPLFVRGVSDAI
jgi:aryl-alcohol dehydrogenase-like predicted oxidoreductase